MSTATKNCLECEAPIVGRSDKKFCDDSCRNVFNNRESRDARNLLRNVNRVLAKNRKILSQLNPNGKGFTNRSVLNAKGFDFQYHTDIYRTKKGAEYVFCYEQGYLFKDNEQVALVVKLDYLL